MAVDPIATTITPTGLALVLLVVTLFFVVPCAVVVILRSWIRVRHGVFGMDDGLMLVGWVLFMCVVGITSRGTYAGIGMRDEDLNDNMQQDGRMYTFLFQTFYCCSLLFIKSSICATLLRIAIERIHRIIIWMTLAASYIPTLTVIIGLLATCRPISANWDPNAGVCSPPIVIMSLSYLVSATTVATDWICAILPGFMLYKARMKRATKVSISIILGLGVLASIATIVRLPYLAYYSKPEDYLHNVANTGLWSIFESGTGIIAGSLPSLRSLVKNWVNFDSSVGQSPAQITPFIGTNRATITSKVGTAIGPQRSHMGIMSNATGARDWEQLDDASSSHKIYVNVDVEMQSLERPAMPSRSGGSLEEVRIPA
ncbi:hypothetical protein ACJ41O_001249 [Fusarium nematophilum]